jgi:hypothetical protein
MGVQRDYYFTLVACFILCNSPAFEFYMPKECSETSAYKIQTQWNYPEGSIKHSEHIGSLNSRVFYACCTNFIVSIDIDYNDKLRNNVDIKHENFEDAKPINEP